MGSHVRKLIELGAIPHGSFPSWMPDAIQYETVMGSVAYGVSGDMSDTDLYAWAMTPKHILFPHTIGHIQGFGKPPEKFDQWERHHIPHPSLDRTYDACVYGIVRYFQLVMENNPNMVDSLFTPVSAVLHSSPIAEMVRQQRKIFLHKGSFHKIRGYAFSQAKKIRSKEAPTGNRKELVDKFGFDVKYAYHVVRLMDQAQQILEEGDLDLTRNAEKLKAIRRGEWTIEDIEEYFTRKESDLETVYTNSKLRHSPDESAIRQLLIDCIEHHYGNLGDALVDPDKAVRALHQIIETAQVAIRGDAQ